MKTMETDTSRRREFADILTKYCPSVKAKVETGHFWGFKMADKIKLAVLRSDSRVQDEIFIDGEWCDITLRVFDSAIFDALTKFALEYEQRTQRTVTIVKYF